MTSPETAVLHASAREFGVAVDAAAEARIAGFVGLLALWSERLPLTGEREQDRIVRRHVIDSLAVVPCLPATGRVVDVGSGAGFPGIVLACLRSDLELMLIESRQRPATFLREVIRSLPLPRARVLEMRAEDAAEEPELARKSAAVVSRAIRLESFLRLAAPLVAPGGYVIAMQTPRTAASAGHRGSLRLAERRHYRLPDGARRCLLLFAPAPAVS